MFKKFITSLYKARQMIFIFAALATILTFFGMGLNQKASNSTKIIQIPTINAPNINIKGGNAYSYSNGDNSQAISNSTVNTTIIDSRAYAGDNSIIVGRGANVSINNQSNSDSFLNDLKAETQEMEREFEKNKLELKQKMKQEFLKNFSENGRINKQNREYPTGWYGFAFPSKYDTTFKAHNIKYIRLNTNKGDSFNDLCKNINKTCTTTIKGSNLTKSKDYGCEIKDEDYLAFCE